MNHIHATLTLSFFLFLAFPHSHSQSSPPLCAQQLYSCSISVPAIFDPFWEQSPPSQCNGTDASSQLICHSRHEYQNFTVKKVNYTSHTMTVLPTNTVKDVCSPDFFQSYENLNKTLLQYYATVHNVLVFFDCPPHIPDFPPKRNLTCGDAVYYFGEGNEIYGLFYRYPLLNQCNRSLLLPSAAPLYDYDDSDDGAGVLKQALNDGFGVKYGSTYCRRCSESDGSCWSDAYDEELVSCQHYCPDQHCSPERSMSLSSPFLSYLTYYILRNLYFFLTNSIPI